VSQPVPHSFSAPGTLHFVCNICDTLNVVDAHHIDREAPTCRHCGSNMRFRSLVAALGQRLFGGLYPLSAFPRNAFVGIGLSDSEVYAQRLARVTGYTNTYYHTEPRFDITAEPGTHADRYDFVISSDVFEHVAPPIQTAFDHLYAVLKPGGVVIFSVPFSLEPDTREHFPDLHDWHIESRTDGNYLLHNTTRDGRTQTFDDLIFHGGPGVTLEMRLFSRAAIERHFARAGFVDVQVHDTPTYRFGIVWPEPWSVTMSARRPL
jgi:SAM-dependent methyltransferase